MNNELTKVDIQKMQEEIDHRIRDLRPQLIEDVKVARAHGDLSENYEYKVAKQEKNKNESRIRYLQNMIKTAIIIEPKSKENEVGLFDIVEILIEKTGKVQKVQIVTTLRQNAMEGYISQESPVGKALIGHKVGDRVLVQVNDKISYTIVIQSLKKSKDDASLPISSF